MPRHPAGRRHVRSTGDREPKFAKGAPAVDHEEMVEQKDIDFSRNRLINFIAEHDISETRLKDLARKFKAEGTSKIEVLTALKMYQSDNYTQRLMNEFDALWHKLFLAGAEAELPEETKQHLNAMDNAGPFPNVRQKLVFDSSGDETRH